MKNVSIPRFFSLLFVETQTTHFFRFFSSNFRFFCGGNGLRAVSMFVKDVDWISFKVVAMQENNLFLENMTSEKKIFLE